MNNGINRHQEFTRQEISKVLARYRASQLGMDRFAREQGIPPGRLHYWMYQKRRSKVRKVYRRGVSAPAFQEVQVAAMLPGVASWAAEVGLPGGRAVRFSGGATPQWIGSVVQALQGPC
jgi:hypothetical protein